MTERTKRAIARDETSFTVGPSALHWDGTGLTLDLDEISVPIPQRIKGRIRLIPEALTETAFALDAAGAHRWWPIAPVARIEVAMQSPAVRWSGHGYFDNNWGFEPLETGFATWDWSRAELSDGSAILYDTRGRDGTDMSLAVRFDRHGKATEFAPPPRTPLPGTLWRVTRGTQAEADGPVRVTQTLEDTPFYARSVLETRLCGETAPAVHESIDLDRFASHWVKLLLPWRMPRRIF